jgi:hypothetical protein
MKLSFSGGTAVLIVLLVAIGEGFFVNPIRFHQTAVIDGFTIHLPVLWAPVKNPGQGVALAFRREWARSGSVAVLDRRGVDPKNTPWTMDAAGKERAIVNTLQGRNPDFKDARDFNLMDGRFTSVCQEATVKGENALVCFVVGTPLEFSYLGSPSYEPVAREMIATLE